MKLHRALFVCLILALLLSVSGMAEAATRPAAPQPIPLRLVGAQDVFAAVNALRQSQGLSPYSWDGGIAAYAQDHSAYQARIDQWTHTHSDGSTAGSRGMMENVAAGDPAFLDAQSIVFQIWADAIHMKTMVGYASGSAGVGVAVSSSTAYVTLNVLPGDAVAVPTLPGGTPGVGLVFTPIALVPLYTTTPRPSGALIHEVGYGQSLWAIAMAYKDYGVNGNRIRELNGMAYNDNNIYAGQRLLIVPAGTLTPPSPATQAPAETQPAASPTIFQTPTRYPTNTPASSGASSATPVAPARAAGGVKGVDPVLIGLIGMACIGLAIFLVSGVKVNRRA